MKPGDVDEILPNYHCGEEFPPLDSLFMNTNSIRIRV